ncbi:MAG TPA: DUF3570 domain-containing protein [Usitatibacter sp.]|nr:DUF3570 domain-containing protein [Usitatibacter sp.]
MAATDRAAPGAVIAAKAGIQSHTFAALAHAALALPILALPVKAGAAEVGEIGLTVLSYKERGLMRITEPVLWGRAQFLESWEVQASAAVDIISGASPQLVSNATGRPVQTITGASVDDRRTTADAKVTKRFGEFSLALSGAYSDEEDYRSKAFGIEGRADLNQRNTTLIAGYGQSKDRVGSSDNPRLDEPRDTREYLAGVTQVLSPTALVSSTVAWSRGRGWYNDPYKLTFTFFPSGPPVVAADLRPDHRNSVAWLTRFRNHVPALGGTLQADYRYFSDDWGIRAHTLEFAWQQSLGPRWSLRPALRYYTQNAADFYSPVVTRPPAAIHSSDQRLAAFGGVSPSMRVILRLDEKLTVEGTLGYVHNARNLRFGGTGSEAFETLRAYYAIVGITHAF